MFKTRLLTLPIIIAGIVLLTGCDHQNLSYYSGIIWGTNYNITVVGDISENELGATVNGVLDSVDSELNMFNTRSELGRFNETGEITPSANFMTVLDESRRISALTGGTFEPTVGALVEYWGFGTRSMDSLTTDSAGWERARASVGLNKVVNEGTVVKRLNPELWLDFGAIAKGFAVDRVSDALTAKGFDRHLVEIGGEVRARGLNRNGEPWAIQIDAPVLDTLVSHHRLGILRLTDGAVATSGNYRNFRCLEDGTVVAHTINPITGKPTQTDLLSVTIVAASTMRADALATGAMVMGLTEAEKLARRLLADPESGFIGAIFVTSNGVTTVGLSSEGASFKLSAE